VEGHIINIGYS